MDHWHRNLPRFADMGRCTGGLEALRLTISMILKIAGIYGITQKQFVPGPRPRAALAAMENYAAGTAVRVRCQLQVYIVTE